MKEQTIFILHNSSFILFFAPLRFNELLASILRSSTGPLIGPELVRFKHSHQRLRMGGDRRSVGGVPQTGFLDSDDPAEGPTLKGQFQKSFFKFIQMQKLLITRLTLKYQLVAVSTHNYVGIMPLIRSTYLGDLFVIGCGERVDNSGITLRFGLIQA